MLLLSVELSSAALYWCSMLAGEVGASILTLALSLLVVGAAEVALGLSLLMLLVLLRHGAVLASSMLLVGSSLPVNEPCCLPAGTSLMRMDGSYINVCCFCSCWSPSHLPSPPLLYGLSAVLDCLTAMAGIQECSDQPSPLAFALVCSATPHPHGAPLPCVSALMKAMLSCSMMATSVSSSLSQLLPVIALASHMTASINSSASITALGSPPLLHTMMVLLRVLIARLTAIEEQASSSLIASSAPLSLPPFISSAPCSHLIASFLCSRPSSSVCCS